MPDTTLQPYHGSYLMPSLDHATVADVMHPGIMSCEATTSFTEVARIMATHRVHCVVVMHAAQDHSGDPYVWGLISDLDLTRAGVDPSEEENAGALAQQPTISVKPNMPLREAAELMYTHRVNHLVVIQPETLRPIGVLSTMDVAAVLAWGEG